MATSDVEMDYEEALREGDENNKNNLAIKELERVPEEVVKQNETASWPQLLSLGPLHHLRLLGKSRIRLYKIMCAAELGKQTLNEIQSAIKALPVTQQLHQSYLCRRGAGNVGHLEMEPLLKMMVLDSIFLLGFLCQQASEVEEEEEKKKKEEEEDVQQPRPQGHMGLNLMELRIKCDVVMLENQLPLQVLYTVMDLLRTTPPPTLPEWLQQPQQCLLQRAVQKLSPFTRHHRDDVAIPISEQEQEQEQEQGLDNKDLLHMLHAAVVKLMTPNDFSSSPQESPPTKSVPRCKWIRDTLDTVLKKCCCCIPQDKTPPKLSMYSAQALKKAGVQFSQGTSLFFDKHSDKLCLPCIEIRHLYTETVLHNLMALELNQYYHINGSKGKGSQCYHINGSKGKGSGSHVSEKPVTRYVELMDCLITTVDDVRLLRKAGVIVNTIELNDEEVMNLWSTIARPFIPRRQKPTFKDITSELDQVLRRKYYRNFLRTQCRDVADRIVKFAHNYMSTSKAWAVILTVLLGGIVFANELIQAYCTFTKCKAS